MSRITAQILIVLLLSGGVAWSESPRPRNDEERFFLLEEQIVTAAKKPQRISDSPSTVHVITRKEMALYPWRHLADLLRMVPGVQVRTWLSQYHNVMIRGMLGTEVANTRILWLVDGASINDVRDGGVWLDVSFPLQHIKRIEIISGPGSALYGTNAFQGIIHLITLDPEDLPTYGTYRARFGSFQQSGVDGAFGRRFGKFGLVVSGAVGFTNGPGFITEQLKISGLSDGRTPSSRRLWQHAFLKFKYDKLLQLTATFRNQRAGFDGAEFFPSQRYKFGQTEVGVNLGLTHNFLKTLNLKATVAYHFFRDRFTDYSDCTVGGCTAPFTGSVVPLTGTEVLVNGITYLYPTDMLQKINYSADQHKIETGAQVQWRFVPINEVIVGVGVRHERINNPEFVTDSRRQAYTNASVYLQDELKLVNDRLLITAGARFDTHKLYKAQFSFRGNVLFKINRRSRIRLSYGSAFKEPAMWQLFIDHLDATGNRNLKPETLHNVELSFAWDVRRWFRWRVDVFYTRMTNIILNNWVPDADPSRQHVFQGRFQPSQQDGVAHFVGVEAEIRSQITKHVQFFVNYSFLDARFDPTTGSTFRLDYDSQHKINAGFAAVFKRFSAAIKVHWVFRTEDKGSGTKQPVGSYTLYQLRLRADLYAGLTLGAQVSYVDSGGASSALGKSRYYEMLGVPVPRWTFLTELAYPF